MTTPALDHVSFSMKAGETRVVFGAAGSGKTTMLKAALGLVKPDSGRIFLFGQDVTELERESAWFDIRARMGILFQEGGLFDSMTIAENVAYPLVNQHAAMEHGNWFRAGNVDERVREALRFVELEQTLEKFPSELSGRHAAARGNRARHRDRAATGAVRFADRRPRSDHREHDHQSDHQGARSAQHRQPSW